MFLVLAGGCATAASLYFSTSALAGDSGRRSASSLSSIATTPPAPSCAARPAHICLRAGESLKTFRASVSSPSAARDAWRKTTPMSPPAR
eukprot:9467302-Pyramimonas_sp.AAC.1